MTASGAGPDAAARTALAVAVGGGAGGLSRGVAVHGVPGDPAVTTLVVNVLGCLAMGLVASWGLAPPWLTTGVLGGLTTFSGWVLDVGRLWPDAPVLAAGLAVLTPVVTVAACAAGLRCGRARSPG